MSIAIRHLFFYMDGENSKPRRPEWVNKILKKRGKSEVLSVSNIKDAENDREIEEVQIKVNLWPKTWYGVLKKSPAAFGGNFWLTGLISGDFAWNGFNFDSIDHMIDYEILSYRGFY